MINDIVAKLMTVPDEQFGYYLFSQDPLKAKVSQEDKKRIIQESQESGRALSRELKEVYGKQTIDEYIHLLGLKVERKESNSGMDYIYFGTYKQPNQITLYMENIKKGEELIQKEKITDFNSTAIEDIVLAHEIFHHFQETRKDHYVNTNKITLWSLGKFEYKSTLVAQAEIAGMAFAKDLLSLGFSPNVLDVFLLYPHDQTLALKINDNILANEKNIKK